MLPVLINGQNKQSLGQNITLPTSYYYCTCKNKLAAGFQGPMTMRKQSITASNMAVSPSVFDGNGAFSYLVCVSFFPQWGKANWDQNVSIF